MDLVLHLPAETEAKLKEQAAAVGRSPEELALIALEEWLAAGFDLADASTPPAPISHEEWMADIRQWAESHPRLEHPADDSRESIYDGCGE